MPQSKDGSSRADSAMRIDPGLVRSSPSSSPQTLSPKSKSKTATAASRSRVNPRRYAARAPVAAAPAPAAAAPQAASAAAGARQEDVSGDAVKSPMVGTAFLSREPGGKPFVSSATR